MKDLERHLTFLHQKRYYLSCARNYRLPNKNDAGMELCNNIRIYDKNIPIIIYTTSKNVNKYYDQINSLGASITASGAELINRIYKLANK
jgi:hypothetical protein